MTEESETLAVLDRRWRTACKVVFKDEVGGILEYAPWLAERNEPIVHRESSISGKETTYATAEYADDAKWADYDEINFDRKFEPLGINEMKDIDSLVGALSDRFYYAGNIVLGNSKNAERSSGISDCFYVYESARFGDSKYIGYCTMGRLTEDMYGCNANGESSFCIKCCETYKNKRNFELWSSQNCSDCYYSYGLNGCSECFFCFHIKNKRHAIGNLELERSKYEGIKSKLLGEMVAELKMNKRLPSLMEIVGRSRIVKPKLPRIHYGGPQQTSMKPIEEAFSKTCELLFGRRMPGDLDRYSAWLTRRLPQMDKCSSAFSGREIHRGDYGNYFDVPKDRLISNDEAPILGEHAGLGKDDINAISFGSIHECIGEIAFFSTEIHEGTNTNMIDCPTTGFSSNCYRTFPVVYSKYCAYSFWPRSSQYIFGCKQVFDSEFCINCYFSVKLKRCFEMDECRDCSDSYFCHNAENLTECMFCFNTKNLRYAIGNVEVGREAYMRIKKLILGEIGKKLEKNKDFELDIYNIGAR